MTPDQMRREEQHGQLMAVAHSLTAAERVMFLGRVARAYPRLDGADVADVLDLTSDHDMFLDQTEPFFTKFDAQMPDGVHYAPLYAAHVIILLGWTLTPGRVWSVMQRAGVVDPPRYPEVEAGLWAYEDGRVTDAGTVTLRARAEQGMRAAGIPEDVITEFRESVRKTDVPGQQFNVGDIAKWVTLADRFTPMPRKVYDPIGDITAVLAWVVVPQQANERTLVERSEQGIKNLRSHLDMRAPETIEASLRAFFGREPE